MMDFISFIGGMLLALLILGAMASLYSLINNHQIRMMEHLRQMKYKIYDLENMLANQDECLCEIRQYLSGTESEKAQPPRSTAARPSGMTAISGSSSRAKSTRGL